MAFRGTKQELNGHPFEASNHGWCFHRSTALAPLPKHSHFPTLYLKYQHRCEHILVGGWTNPLEKYARQIGSSPQVKMNIKHHKTRLSCHHPVFHAHDICFKSIIGYDFHFTFHQRFWFSNHEWKIPSKKKTNTFAPENRPGPPKKKNIVFQPLCRCQLLVSDRVLFWNRFETIFCNQVSPSLDALCNLLPAKVWMCLGMCQWMLQRSTSHESSRTHQTVMSALLNGLYCMNKRSFYIFYVTEWGIPQKAQKIDRHLLLSHMRSHICFHAPKLASHRATWSGNWLYPNWDFQLGNLLENQKLWESSPQYPTSKQVPSETKSEQECPTDWQWIKLGGGYH